MASNKKRKLDMYTESSDITDLPYNLTNKQKRKDLLGRNTNYAFSLFKSPTSNDFTPLFLIISRKGEGDLKKLSPFLIFHGIRRKVGEVKTIKKLRDGTIFVETKEAFQSKKLLESENLFGVEVSVTPHKYLNCSKGIISWFDLEYETVENIKRELEDQGVTNVERINFFRNGSKIKSNKYILTFSTPILPKEIKIAYQLLPVKLFVPPPIRCNKCFFFRHTANRCNKDAVCRNCSQKKHEGPCTSGSKCNVCKGPHPSWHRKCPKYIEEFEISKLMEENKLPYARARLLFINSPSQLAKRPFSDLLRVKTFSSVCTQTDKQVSGQADLGSEAESVPAEPSPSETARPAPSPAEPPRGKPVLPEALAHSASPPPLPPAPRSPSPPSPPLSNPPSALSLPNPSPDPSPSPALPTEEVSLDPSPSQRRPRSGISLIPLTPSLRGCPLPAPASEHTSSLPRTSLGSATPPPTSTQCSTQKKNMARSHSNERRQKNKRNN